MYKQAVSLSLDSRRTICVAYSWYKTTVHHTHLYTH